MVKKVIRYLGKQPIDKKTGVIPIKWRTTKAEMDYLYQYGKVYKILARLTKPEIILIYLAANNMSVENLIRNDAKFRVNYNRLFKNKYADKSISRFLRRLVEIKLLIRLPHRRGLYKVNPKYFMKKEKYQRIKSIRRDYETASQPHVNRYRMETFDKDKIRKIKK